MLGLKMYFTRTSDGKLNGRYSENISSILSFSDIEYINNYIPIINNDNNLDYDSGLMAHAIIEAIRSDTKRKFSPSDFEYYFTQIYNLVVRLYKEITGDDFVEQENLYSNVIKLHGLRASRLWSDDFAKEYKMLMDILQSMMSLNSPVICTSFSDYRKFTLNGIFDLHLYVDDFFQTFRIKDQAGRSTPDFFIPTIDYSLTHELVFKSLKEDLKLSARDIFRLTSDMKGRLFGESYNSDVRAFHNFFVLKCDRNISDMFSILGRTMEDTHHSDYAMNVRVGDERLELLTTRHQNLYHILDKTRNTALTTNWVLKHE